MASPRPARSRRRALGAVPLDQRVHHAEEQPADHLGVDVGPDGNLVHDIAIDEVSHVDRAYLAATAVDADQSSTREIAHRLDGSPDYANVCRRRLIDAELIEERGRGYVGCTLPYFTDHMRTRPEFQTILAANPTLVVHELLDPRPRGAQGGGESGGLQ